MAITREARQPVPVARAAGASHALYDKLSPGPGKSASEVAAHQRARIHGAMIKLVAERDYSAVTVRELARLAGVSSRAFYKLFDDKESCFRQTYEMVVRRVAKQVIASQAGERDWLKRLLLAFDTFFSELEQEPQAAHLALVEAYTVGSVMRGPIRQAERTFEAMVDESFSRAPDGMVMPPIVIEGIVAGIISIVRDRDLDEPEGQLRELAKPLLLWSLSYCSNYVTPLDPAGHTMPPCWEGPDEISSIALSGGETQMPTSDRALILSAVVKLASTESCEELTVRGICAAAGISRRRFDELFSSADECLLTAFEQRIAAVLDNATFTQVSGRPSTTNVMRRFVRFCIQIAADPVLSNPCFGQALSSSPIRARHDGQRPRRDGINDLIRLALPVEADRDSLSCEASIAAAWGLMRRHIESGRARELSQIAPALAHIAVAPSISRRASIEADRPGGRASAVGKHQGEELDRSKRRRDAFPALGPQDGYRRDSKGTNTVTNSERNQRYES